MAQLIVICSTCRTKNYVAPKGPEDRVFRCGNCLTMRDLEGEALPDALPEPEPEPEPEPVSAEVPVAPKEKKPKKPKK